MSQFRLLNYSSFAETEWIPLSPRLNVVVGLNNSGKSALLLALTPNLPAIQHRNDQRYLPGDLKPPTAELDIATTSSELRARLIETGMAVRTVAGGATVADHHRIKAMMEADTDLTLKIQSRGGSSFAWREPTFSSAVSPDSHYIVKVRATAGDIRVEGDGSGRDDTVVQLFSAGDDPRFFHFTAQRYNIASIAFSSEKRLRSDASNLPAVLAYLSGNSPETFREIENRVREILPGVGSMTVSTEEGNFKILIWPSVGPRVRDLAFDLAHSGTGVAQVIAIMTAVVTSDASVILIDEINSYLHPAATKQLLQILTTFYPHHQYVISSHSSDVMSFHDIDNMLMVEKTDFKSSIRVVNRNDLNELRSAFRHLGISMTDVLGADRLVWVEGATEELVFPETLRRAGIEIEGSIRFSSVAATGDFTKRGSSKKAVIDLYTAATAASAPLVQGSSFLLDRETLTDEAVEQIEKKTDKRLRLLSRRCLECYALHPPGIAALINTEVPDLSLEAIQVEQEIARLASDKAFGAASRWRGNINDRDWLKKVDAAKLLESAFANLTEHRLSFQKTKHTPRLIAAMPIEQLGELVKSLKSALRSAGVVI